MKKIAFIVLLSSVSNFAFAGNCQALLNKTYNCRNGLPSFTLDSKALITFENGKTIQMTCNDAGFFEGNGPTETIHDTYQVRSEYDFMSINIFSSTGVEAEFRQYVLNADDGSINQEANWRCYAVHH